MVNDSVLKRINIFCRNDDLESINCSNLVRKSCFGIEIEGQVVAKVFAWLRQDLEAQTQLLALCLGIAQFEQFDVRDWRDRDNGVGFVGRL